jgi:hypothetical protein
MAVKVYLDMDGVLADFATPAGEFWGVRFDKEYVKLDGAAWKKLQRAWPTFWMDLEYMPYALELWRALQPWHPSLLTALPESWPSGATGKLVWAKRMLPKFGYHPEQTFHCVMRRDKQKYAMTKGQPNALIDDTKKNIQEWEAAGGIGIFYTPSALMIQQVVQTLRQLD